MPKTTIISIPDEYLEDLKKYHKEQYAQLSFNTMFVDITVREMQRVRLEKISKEK